MNSLWLFSDIAGKRTVQVGTSTHPCDPPYDPQYDGVLVEQGGHGSSGKTIEQTGPGGPSRAREIPCTHSRFGSDMRITISARGFETPRLKPGQKTAFGIRSFEAEPSYTHLTAGHISASARLRMHCGSGWGCPTNVKRTIAQTGSVWPSRRASLRWHEAGLSKSWGRETALPAIGGETTRGHQRHWLKTIAMPVPLPRTTKRALRHCFCNEQISKFHIPDAFFPDSLGKAADFISCRGARISNAPD